MWDVLLYIQVISAGAAVVFACLSFYHASQATKHAKDAIRHSEDAQRGIDKFHKLAEEVKPLMLKCADDLERTP